MNSGFSHFSPAGAALRRWSLWVQLTIVSSSAVAALIAARWAGDVGAALGMLQALAVIVVFATGLVRAVTVLQTQLQALCNGDLLQEVTLGGKDELAALGSQMRVLTHHLSQVVARICAVVAS